MSLKEVFGPPVWGYVGLNHIVDTCHTKCLYRNWELYRKPRKNPLKQHRPAKITFTSPPSVVVEKRDICFRTHSCELMWTWVNNMKNSFKRTFGFLPCMSQVNATINIIRMWLSEFSKEIISVGIQSDGSYDIPEGIVFSQPVCLKDGKWKIYKKLPLPHYTIKLRNLIALPLIISETYNLLDDIPDVNEYFLPEKEVKNEEINLIKHQKELQEKRAAILNKKGLLQKQPDEEDTEKRLKRKNKMIEDLKDLRQRMKAINQSNPYSWLNKYMSKIKPEKEAEPSPEVIDVPPEGKEPEQRKASEQRTQSKKMSFSNWEEGETEDAEEEVEEEETEEERWAKLFQVTTEEVDEAMKSFNIIEELGTCYGNKVLSKISEGPIGKVRPERKDPHPPIKEIEKYRLTCQPEGFHKKV